MSARHPRSRQRRVLVRRRHRYSERLAAALAARGVDAELVVAPREPVPVALARDIRRRDAELVHVQYAPASLRHARPVGLLPLLLPRLPVVTTLHEYGGSPWPRLLGRLAAPVEQHAAWDRETGRLVPRSSAVVVTNEAHARLVHDRFRGVLRPHVLPVPPNVAPVGLDRAEARRAVRAQLGLPHDAPLLVFFGFVHPVKGVRYLLEALVPLRRVRPALHLVVAGGTESLALPASEARQVDEELRDRARSLAVDGAVTWTGYRPAEEVSALLLAADVVVLPFTAGLTTKSGALAAALAHGAPVVGVRPPTPDPSLVADRDAVLVDAPRDGAALAEAVGRVLDDAALRSRLRRRGLEQAATRSWDAVAAGHVALYTRALANVPLVVA